MFSVPHMEKDFAATEEDAVFLIGLIYLFIFIFWTDLFLFFGQFVISVGCMGSLKGMVGDLYCNCCEAYALTGGKCCGISY